VGSNREGRIYGGQAISWDFERLEDHEVSSVYAAPSILLASPSGTNHANDLVVCVEKLNVVLGEGIKRSWFGLSNPASFHAASPIMSAPAVEAFSSITGLSSLFLQMTTCMPPSINL
jgi:hypothetical protein